MNLISRQRARLAKWLHALATAIHPGEPVKISAIDRERIIQEAIAKSSGLVSLKIIDSASQVIRFEAIKAGDSSYVVNIIELQSHGGVAAFDGEGATDDADK